MLATEQRLEGDGVGRIHLCGQHRAGRVDHPQQRLLPLLPEGQEAVDDQQMALGVRLLRLQHLVGPLDVRDRAGRAGAILISG